VRTYIILPPTIWGIATGRLFNLGLANRHSIQIPVAIKASLDRGQGGVIGEGKNSWPHVEVHERELLFIQLCLILSNSTAVAEMYQILFDAALSDPNVSHGREGYYFVENGEYRLYDLAKTYSQALYDLGKGKSPEPTAFTDEEAQKYFGVITFHSIGVSAETDTQRIRALSSVVIRDARQREREY
jgi:hypothetical protein